jgi:hypothetical protein
MVKKVYTMTSQIFFLINLLILATGLCSCSFHEAKTPATTSSSTTNPSIQFSPAVYNVVFGICIGCHNGIGANGYIPFITNPERLIREFSVQDPSWRYIVPGDPDHSLIYKKVSETNPPVGVRMPFESDYLSAEEIEAIRQWILSLPVSTN